MQEINYIQYITICKVIHRQLLIKTSHRSFFTLPFAVHISSQINYLSLSPIFWNSYVNFPSPLPASSSSHLNCKDFPFPSFSHAFFFTDHVLLKYTLPLLRVVLLSSRSPKRTSQNVAPPPIPRLRILSLSAFALIILTSMLQYSIDIHIGRIKDH